MQELSLSIQQRITKTKQVIESYFPTQTIRSLREEEKIRCEKENFILSMMKANKIMSPTLKKSYLRVSYQMMILLQPSFSHKNQTKSDEDFLNQFVQLYTSFFAYFEDKFAFKTKIKNFLRPTNHNLIVDLIKYFVDFTRDYYVQTLFWKIRNLSKIENSTLLPFQENCSVQNNEDISIIKCKQFGISRKISSLNDLTEVSISPRKRADDSEQKGNSQKNYEILEVSIPSITLITPKEHFANIESLKIKVNELFRDQKSRNHSVKKIYQDYFSSYNEKFNKSQNQSFPIPYLSNFKKFDQLNAKCHPIRLLLSVQKYGFSLILIEVDNKKIKNCYFPPNNKFYSSSNNNSVNNSPTKTQTQNSLSPLKITQRLIQSEDQTKGDYFLTSMKVLRVSQNFLPPLVTSNILHNKVQSRKEIREISFKQQMEKDKNQSPFGNFSLKLRKMASEFESQMPFISDTPNSQSTLFRSGSFYNPSAQKEKRRIEIFNNELYAGDYVHPKDLTNIKLRRQESLDTNYRPLNKNMNIKNKYNEERKSYQNGAFLNAKYYSKQATVVGFQSEQKILHWLEKIKNLKEIQRKKILGMNY